MNVLDRDEWVSQFLHLTVVDCNDCKKQTPTKESFKIQRDCEYFGVKGFMYVPVCKECYREQQLNKIV